MLGLRLATRYIDFFSLLAFNLEDGLLHNNSTPWDSLSIQLFCSNDYRRMCVFQRLGVIHPSRFLLRPHGELLAFLVWSVSIASTEGLQGRCATALYHNAITWRSFSKRIKESIKNRSIASIAPLLASCPRKSPSSHQSIGY